jgi:hypothetical protein
MSPVSLAHYQFWPLLFCLSTQTQLEQQQSTTRTRLTITLPRYYVYHKYPQGLASYPGHQPPRYYFYFILFLTVSFVLTSRGWRVLPIWLFFFFLQQIELFFLYGYCSNKTHLERWVPSPWMIGILQPTVWPGNMWYNIALTAVCTSLVAYLLDPFAWHFWDRLVGGFQCPMGLRILNFTVTDKEWQCRILPLMLWTRRAWWSLRYWIFVAIANSLLLYFIRRFNKFWRGRY